MIKKRELHETHALYTLMTHPDVFPFVRQKAYSHEEYLFLTKQTIEAEERGEIISRTIIDEWGNPIGTINLFDIENNAGFLGTWIGKPYHGKGYNQLAKEAFFQELFFEKNIETIYMRIRVENIRSKKAAQKLPYALLANKTRKNIYEFINQNTNKKFDLYEIPKDLYTMYHLKKVYEQHENQALEA